MTDEEYVFRQDVREKAITARSSHKTINAARGRCRFRTDHMSRREWEKMNGHVNSVTLGRPMRWEEFCNLPESLRKQYIQDILAHYDIGPNALARMFGVSGPYCGKRLRELGFTFKGRTSPRETQRFLAEFFTAAPTAIEPAAPELSLDRISVTFSGEFSPELVAAKLATLFETGREAVVTIEVAAK